MQLFTLVRRCAMFHRLQAIHLNWGSFATISSIQTTLYDIKQLTRTVNKIFWTLTGSFDLFTKITTLWNSIKYNNFRKMFFSGALLVSGTIVAYWSLVWLMEATRKHTAQVLKLLLHVPTSMYGIWIDATPKISDYFSFLGQKSMAFMALRLATYDLQLWLGLGNVKKKALVVFTVRRCDFFINNINIAMLVNFTVRWGLDSFSRLCGLCHFLQFNCYTSYQLFNS